MIRRSRNHKIEDVASYDAIAEKLNMFAGVSGKSPKHSCKIPPDELDEDTLPRNPSTLVHRWQKQTHL